jgi:hypothetical protein
MEKRVAMSNDGAVKIMDPPPNVVVEKLPAMEMLAEVKHTSKQAIAEAKDVSLRTGKTVVAWWRGLPNNEVRAAVAAGVGLVLGMIPVLFILSRRRNAPLLERRHATTP